MMCALPIIFATLPLRVVTRILLPWAQHLNASINALQKKKKGSIATFQKCGYRI